jgi:hypothetical protein
MLRLVLHLILFKCMRYIFWGQRGGMDYVNSSHWLVLVLITEARQSPHRYKRPSIQSFGQIAFILFGAR